MSREFEGTFEDIRRHLIGKGREDERHCYLGMKGRVTIQQLIDHLSAVAPGRSLSEFGLNFATVTWDDAATEAEKRVRAEQQRRHDERHEQWERETFERLKEKFEPASLSVHPGEKP